MPRLSTVFYRQLLTCWLLMAGHAGLWAPAISRGQSVPGARQAARADQPLDGAEGRELLLRNFRPVAQLKLTHRPISRARFAVVDVHGHFGYRLKGSQQALEQYLAVMDRNGIAVCCSLDAPLGSEAEHREYLWRQFKDRLVYFVHLDWRGAGKESEPRTWACNRPGFAARVAKQLAAARENGASGLKLFKQFGLQHRNADGSLIAIDDPRFDPIWKACGDLGMPVLIHTADPAAFFLPIDAKNERWEELSRHPDWSFHGSQFPSRKELLEARNRVILRHPKTMFIGAHVANNSEDLAEVSKWLEQMPNLHVEIASRIGELGRQPYTARKFFIRHADRILFGTDGPWPEQRLRLYWRFCETWDEYFPYSEKPFPPQGLWQIYGLGLPDPVLRKIYHENAARLVPGVAERLRKAREAGG